MLVKQEHPLKERMSFRCRRWVSVIDFSVHHNTLNYVYRYLISITDMAVRTEFVSGLIRLHILYHAARGPVFGLELIRELRRHGYELSPGTLYPILHGIEERGYLRSSKTIAAGKIRRLYKATGSGKRMWPRGGPKCESCLGSCFNRKSEDKTMTTPAAGKLRELTLLFLRLGFTAFGGPAAHIALMEDEVVRRRQWMTRGTTPRSAGSGPNLIPGPSSTEMAIYIGYTQAGWAGIVLGGVCFILPAALITLALAWCYMRLAVCPRSLESCTG